MSHATLADPVFTTRPISPAVIRRLHIARDTLLASIQSATFAAILWLILAGPGFLQDLASTVPLR